MARTLRAEPSALRIAIRFLSRRFAPVHQAAAVDSRPREHARVSAMKVETVEVPQLNFLMVDGKGNPNTAKSFSDAIEALYPVAYTLKFMVKKGAGGVDYGVMPLEAFWWADDMSAFSTGNKDSSDHPHGIKVRLEGGIVGRVKEILGA